MSTPSIPNGHRTLDRRLFVRQTAHGLAFLAFGKPLVAPWRFAGRSGSLREAESAQAVFRFLISDPAFVYSRPCFSPSGDRVLFMRAPTSQDPVATLNSDASPWSLWTAPVEGGPPSLLFEHHEIRATRPDWSRTTGRIAFTGISNDRAELWLMSESGADLTHIAVGDPPRRRVLYPSWYPDGSALAVTDYNTRRVLRVDLADRRVEPLTDPNEVWAGMSSVSPSSSAGNPLAFAGQRPGGRYEVQDNTVWIQSRGQAPFQLDSQPGRQPAWSPRGDRLAFSSTRRRLAPAYVMRPRTLPSRNSTIYIARPSLQAAPAPLLAVTPFDVHAQHAKWSPDGRSLACMASVVDGSVRGIAIVQIND